MPSQNKKDLYLARSLADLQKFIQKAMKMNVDYFKAAEKLYNRSVGLSILEPLDEEMLYVICSRYINMVAVIKETVKDERFYNARYAQYLAKVSAIKEGCASSLYSRYNLLEKETKSPTQEPQEVEDILEDNDLPTPTEPTVDLLNEEDIFLSPDDLYNMIVNDSMKLLIIDIRRESDFNVTKIKHPDVINIPEILIGDGQTTHSIQSKLIDENKEKFNKRKNYHVCVLIDCDTSAVTLQKTKIQTLRNILIHWDNDINDSDSAPFILCGGVLAWADNYPTLINEPNLVYSSYYTQFDEFTDEIAYPDDQPLDLSKTKGDHKDKHEEEQTVIGEEVPTVIGQGDEPAKKLPKRDSRDSESFKYLQKVKILANHQLKVEQKLLSVLQDLIASKKNLNVKHNSVQRSAQKARHIVDLTKIISKNESLRIQLNEKRMGLLPKYTEIRSNMDDEMKEIVDEIMQTDNSVLSVYQDRKEVERKGGYYIGKQLETAEQSESRRKIARITPVPDRSSKPGDHSSSSVNSYLDRLPYDTLAASRGIVGLVNINNTCYINSLIQCLRFCRNFIGFVSSTNDKDELTFTLSQLVLKLWREDQASVRPTSFYNSVCKRDKANRFNRGLHEDVQEFYLFLIKELDIDNRQIFKPTGELSSRVKALMTVTDMHRSHITNMFYWQIEINQVCPQPECSYNVVRYDHENTILITLPEDGSSVVIQEEVTKFLKVSDHEREISKFCTNCELKTEPTKQVTFYPQILIINLVRQKYCSRTGSVRRLNNPCSFSEEIMFDKCLYKLRSISCHKGDQDRGHYTAICLQSFTNRWVEFNDDRFKYVNGLVGEFRIKAYMLFYELDTMFEDVNKKFYD